MAEFDTSKTGHSLMIDEKYYNTLNIEGFSHMMKDLSYCYKFYWLETIVQIISEGVRETIFLELSEVNDVFTGEAVVPKQCKGNSQEEFYNILLKNMRPVYDSARRQGYEIWNRGSLKANFAK